MLFVHNAMVYYNACTLQFQNYLYVSGVLKRNTNTASAFGGAAVRRFMDTYACVLLCIRCYIVFRFFSFFFSFLPSVRPNRGALAIPVKSAPTTHALLHVVVCIRII